MKIEIDKLLENQMEEILQGTAQIVAETSVEYFQNTFQTKKFDGNPWAPPRVPKRSGSLLVQSGALLNSIRPVLVSPERIVIAAGNEKVDYARVHNEGFEGEVTVSAHKRVVKTAKIGVKGEEEQDSDEDMTQNVKEHTRMMRIPQRQFMGEAKELDEKLHKAIEAYLESVLTD